MTETKSHGMMAVARYCQRQEEPHEHTKVWPGSVLLSGVLGSARYREMQVTRATAKKPLCLPWPAQCNQTQSRTDVGAD